MFQAIYELLSTHIFNGNPSSTAYGVLFCEGISTIACGLLVLIPFFIMWRIIKHFL